MAERNRSTISIIVAAMNEERHLEEVVRQTLDCLEEFFSDFEIILVNDGSIDQTAKIMDRMAENHPKLRAIHNPRNAGLGRVYQQGLSESRFEYVMLLCGDGGLPPSSLPAIFDKVGTADIVIPYMVNLPEIKSRSRYLSSRVYTWLVNTLFRLNLHYFNGLPVHRTELVRSLEINSTGFAFQAEAIIKSIRAGATYVEVGVLGSMGKPSRSALRPRNLISIVRTLTALVLSVHASTKLQSHQ